MKRWQIIFISLLLLFTLWVWSYTQLELCNWLAIPLVAAVLLALYAANDILGSIIKLKSYPEERTSLDQEIAKAKEFYKSINKPYFEK